MALELEKAVPVGLRSLGLDEKWLQDRISADPGLLGLGDLEIAGREHRQPIGGRLDFLMRNTEAEIYYEVEIMLGALDESHIIRTIEYWDIERQRRPQWDHRAVIVAEQITTRFFNVLRLLNRAIPLIAVKLSAFQMNDKIVLHPVTVLDVIEESADPDVLDPVERTDRTYWEKKMPPAVLIMTDKTVSSLRADGVDPRLTYNRHHIAIGTTGRNFCWFHARKSPGNCHVEMRFSSETRDPVLSSLQDNRIDASPRLADFLTFNITTGGFDEHFGVLKNALLRAEEDSRQ